MKKCILLLLSTLAPALKAQFSIQNVLSPPFPTELKASGNGHTLAWVFNDRGERNIFVSESPFDQSRPVTSYTGDEGLELGQLNISTDGQRIAFVRGNAANSRGEAANPAFLQVPTGQSIWIMDRDGSHLRNIGPGTSPSISPDGRQLVFLHRGEVWISDLNDTAKPVQKLFQSRGTMAQLRWSPDGNKLAFVSHRGDHSFVGIYDFSIRSVYFVKAGVDRDQYPAWSPDGGQLAYIRVPHINKIPPFTAVRTSNPWSIRVFDLGSGTDSEVWKADEGRGSAFTNEIPVVENPLWWLDENQMLFPYEKTGWQLLYTLDIGKQSVSLLTPGKGEIENVCLSPDRKTLYYTTNIDDPERRHIWKMDLPDGKPFCITPGMGIEWSPVPISSGLAFLQSSAKRPAWPAVLKGPARQDLAAERFPADFPSALVEPKLVKIKSTDGMMVSGDLFLPPGYHPGLKYPALIFLHGGSRRQMLVGFHYSQYYSNAYALNQYFASRGYIVLSLNYRSGIGYGLDFREALNYGAGGATEVRDLIAAGHFLRNRTDVIMNKISLWGGSYGGYLTAHGLSQASQHFACGVDIHGVHNWNDEIPTFAPWYDAAKFPVFAKTALESSPVHHVKSWIRPVLFIHGDDDRNVPFSETVNMIQQLRTQGVHTESLVLPDEVHGFLLHKSWLKVYEASFEFIDRQMTGK
ncbi:MAG TPA: prolyl oligopeptidase family serine peptidase [Saprospiraceae bacterium]|nr:prolyl oligopeptidase family serine peptidase [Saprospiraceae bacterium]